MTSTFFQRALLVFVISFSFVFSKAQEYKYEILESLNWLNKDLLIWIENLNHVEMVIEENKKNIKSSDFALDN